MQEGKQTLFDQGVAAGLDPDSRLAPEQSRLFGSASREQERRVTGMRSPWVYRRCSTCGHSFRLGDEVILGSSGEVVHDMPGLRCAPAASPDTPPPTAAWGRYEDFFAGLNQACPLPLDVPVLRLVGEHPLLAPPQRGHARLACRVCGHTFRPSDHVVICPCFPDAPRCVAAIHQDPWRQLYCWDEWRRAGDRNICLGMS